MPIAQISERVADFDTKSATIDVDARLVRGVVICGPQSQNGYAYPADTLAAAVPKYDKVPVFLDHVSKNDPNGNHNRSVRDLVGYVTNPRFENGCIVGDVQCMSNIAGSEFLAVADAYRGGDVGMSHVAIVRTSKAGDRVEDIFRVFSVDLVIGPATTKSVKQKEDVGRRTESPGTHGTNTGRKVPRTTSKRTLMTAEQANLIRAEAIAKEGRRQTGIMEVFKKSGLDMNVAQAFVSDTSHTVEDAKVYVLRQLQLTEDIRGSHFDEDDPSTKYRREFEANRSALLAIGLTEEQYVESCLRSDEGGVVRMTT